MKGMRWLSAIKIAAVMAVGVAALYHWQKWIDFFKEFPERTVTSGAVSTVFGVVTLLALATFGALWTLAVRVSRLEEELEKRSRDNPG
jgi:hypothetical protein